MKTTLLACTDGSGYAASVCDHAAWAALRLDASIQLLHALEPEPPPFVTDLTGGMGLDLNAALVTELVNLGEARARLHKARALAFLAAGKNRLLAAGLTDVTLREHPGHLVDLADSPNEHHALVVLGKRGEHANLARLHLGSQLERFVRATHLNVLVASRTFHPPSSALIAYDAGPAAERAIQLALTSPLFADLHLHLVSVGHPRPNLAEHLETARIQLVAAGREVTAEHHEGVAENILAKCVRTHRADLLVIGAYGHSRLRQFIIGSTTSALLRTEQMPLLIIR